MANFARIFLVCLRLLRAHGLAFLVALVVAVVASATWGYARLEGMRWSEALYTSVALFTFSQVTGYPKNHVGRIDAFLAPLLTASALFRAFARVLEQRAPLLLWRPRGHTVVGGLGRLGMAVAQHESARNRAFVALEVNEHGPQIASANRLAGGAVLVGDMTSAALLKKARCHHARRVFFTAASDIANLDAALIVRRMARAANVKAPPEIYAHVFDASLVETLAPHLFPRVRGDAEIIPFSSHRFAARSLLAILVREHFLPRLHFDERMTLV